MSRDVVVVHPGVQHSGDLAASLDRVGRLAFLATRLQVGGEARWPWSVSSLRARIPRRIVADLGDARIQRIGPLDEMFLRSIGPRLPQARFRQLDRASMHRFIRRAVARLDPEVRVVIGTDTASLELFRCLADQRPDIARVLDVSHPLDVAVQPLIREDAARWGLDPAAYDDFHPGPAKDQRAEIESADVVLVASRFSESTFHSLELPEGRIHRVPYAVPSTSATRLARATSQPLRLLALGAMSERKGMSLLIRAMRQLQAQSISVQLVIAGRESGGYRLPRQLPANTRYVGSPTREGVANLYAESDVLVLPSMCEGFGRTLLEALAAGMSVITTERSGGPDILERVPTAPVRIVPTDGRDTLANIIVEHVDNFPRFVRPGDARAAAAAFTDDHYLNCLQAAISAAKETADGRLNG